MTNDKDQILELTAQVVTAYVSRNALQIADVPGLIDATAGALRSLGQTAPTVRDAPIPAVNPKRSVFPDYIVCLEDGKKFKSLKRHIAKYGMTPDEYRQRWGLPDDYPMVAPNYSATRSALAKSMGLGTKENRRHMQ